MSAPSRAVRLLATATFGITFYLFWAFPAWLAPTLAIAAFVLLCFLLRCASPWSTLVFASVMAAIPVLLFAGGLSFHTSIAGSLGQSFQGFTSQPLMLLWLVVLPFIAGSVLHLLLFAVARGSKSTPRRNRAG